MVDHWKVSAPVMQARVQRTDDDSLDHTLTLTVTFKVAPNATGSKPDTNEHEVSRAGDPLRLVVPMWTAPLEVPLEVRVPNVLGFTDGQAEEALREAELEPLHGPTGHILTDVVSVVSQDPPGDAWAAPGSGVSLVYGPGYSISGHPFEPFVICDRVSCEDPLHDPSHPLEIPLVIGGE